MGIENDIPELKQEHRDLLMLLRAAIAGTPPDGRAEIPLAKARRREEDRGTPPNGKDATTKDTKRPINWQKVLEIARFHQVDMFLYPAVAGWPPALQPEPELMSRWKKAYFSAAVRYEQASAQLKEILQALHEADVPAIPLKGAWLAEKVYAEGAQRPMCDLDLLVPLEQFDRARAVFESLGYTTPDHYFDTARDKDIHYRHADRPMMVELHFRIWHEIKTNVVEPDSNHLWKDPIKTTMFGIPVFALPPERLIVYVAQHMLYSSLTIPMRAYLDLILLARGADFDPVKLETEAQALGVPFGATFVIQVALDIAAMEAPKGLADFLATENLSQRREGAKRAEMDTCKGGSRTRLEESDSWAGRPCHDTHYEKERLLALRSTLELTGASSQIRPEIADSQGTSLITKTRIGWGVVFKPAGFIRSAYPEAVRKYGIAGGYWARLQDVAKRSALARKKARQDDPTLETDLQNFNTRRDMCDWLLSCDKKQKSPVGDRAP